MFHLHKMLILKVSNTIAPRFFKILAYPKIFSERTWEKSDHSGSLLSRVTSQTPISGGQEQQYG